MSCAPPRHMYLRTTNNTSHLSLLRHIPSERFTAPRKTLARVDQCLAYPGKLLDLTSHYDLFRHVETNVFNPIALDRSGLVVPTTR